MRAIEAKIANLLRSKVQGARPSGVIRCDADDGVVGYTSSIESGLLMRKKSSLDDLLGDSAKNTLDFSDTLLELRESSKAQPLGPWYRCNIEIRPIGKVSFTYFWEGTPFSSVSELEPNLHGGVPHFVFKHRFDRALVGELSDFDVGGCLLFYVPARVSANKPVSEPLLQVYCTLEWEGDVNNGAMDQYFAREHEPMTGLPRSGLYEKTYRGLQRIGHEQGAALFSESVALYAHFYERVELAREQLKLPAVPRQEQSDIMSRYYALQQSIEAARVAYIRERIDELEQAA